MTPRGRRGGRRDPYVIRTARPTDVDALVPLWTEYVSFHERVGGERLAPQGAELRVREVLREDISDRTAHLLVAEEDGALLGYGLGRLVPIPPMYPGRRLGVVHELVVTEEARMRGIGMKLAYGLLDWFREKKVARAEITILVENEDARAFWERIGFDIRGFRMERKL